ncbi:MAG TPA: DUF4149 domain-containing protein [Gemmatimonadaceae bacterium]|nr:DUF4149 domain-containing protein [Gemmatimonadaceae bacterium]
MPIAYYINVTIHVLAAMLWIGGMLFLGLVGAPVLRAVEPPALRQSMFDTLGRRFRTVGWIAVAVAVVTGVGNLQFRGLLHWHGVLDSRAFWSTRPGMALALKLAFVLLMILVEAYHDFVIGPRAGRAEPGSAEAARLRVQASRLARMAGACGLGVVAAAVVLAR